ncbi:hypothetical protein LQ327_22595 [Actinomycetospora endophytica]|uniref:ATPase n=1 Tax=Actinomycetospora endophytica TaxID=2291215 RepID=A0ABS8PFG6_9PSEU|nr:hypothetical protein [Actinomycetospora endophytica]MCD2196166.1 hypothetical protein [Actinomycetospora endophytica]
MQALNSTDPDQTPALDAALEAGDDELAVLVAIGDEPLGLSVLGDARRLARLHRLDGRSLPPRRQLDLLAATIREAGAAREDIVALVEQARALADAVATDDLETQARIRALEARTLVDQPYPALDRLAVALDAHRLAVATEDPSLQLDATELLMTAELAVGHTERAHKLCQELDTEAQRWSRPRSLWAARVADAAMLLAEGDPGAEAAAELAAELALPSAQIAAGAHLLVSRLLEGRVSELGTLAAYASSQSPNTAAWAAAAALAEVCAGHDDEARAHLAEYVRRAATGRVWFTRAAAAMAAGAACGLGDSAVVASVREVLPADPDAAVLVGFGGAVLGPVTLWTGLAAWTLDDEATARADWSAAAALAERAGWAPWSAAIRQLLTVLDDGVAPLPFGLPRRGRMTGAPGSIIP